jgi:hypothetical protein
MKQMLHIFAKDSRQFWPEILISLALVATFVWIYPSSWLSGNTIYAVAGGAFVPALLEGFLGGMVKVLIPVSWWLLIARVIHAEALVGDCQFWLTRPYEWKKLLGAKAIFLVVFLYLPLLIAQCLLLLRAGFSPLSYVSGLLFNLLLITGILVLPLVAIASVTATFARVTVTLLAGLAGFIGFIAISLGFSNNVSIPTSDHLGIPLAFCFCGTVVVLQYSARRVWVSRLLLIAFPIVLVLSGLAVPESTMMRRAYPRASAGQEAPVQLTLLRDTPHPATAYLVRANQLQVSIPVQVSGVAAGYALIPDALRVTIDAANGSHWTSPWQPASNSNYLPGTSESGVGFLISRAAFDQLRSMPVTLHFTLALTLVQAGNVRNIPLSTQDFSVPDFGICSPDPRSMDRQFLGIACRFALRPPGLTYINVRWADGSCQAPQPGPGTAVEGDSWVGTLENSPADFGITSVWSPPISLSNGTKVEGNKSEPRYLCPGTPVTFTQYNPVRRTQYDFAIPDFRFPSYRPDEGSFARSTGINFTIN